MLSSDVSQLLLDEVRQVRKLLELLAEPAIAERDKKLRDELRSIVGSSAKKQQSVLIMDGTRTQKQINTETGLHQGDLSVMVGKLEAGGLLAGDKKLPKLSINILSNFFDGNTDTKRR